jgi:hypothetical protein
VSCSLLLFIVRENEAFIQTLKLSFNRVSLAILWRSLYANHAAIPTLSVGSQMLTFLTLPMPTICSSSIFCIPDDEAVFLGP